MKTINQIAPQKTLKEIKQEMKEAKQFSLALKYKLQGIEKSIERANKKGLKEIEIQTVADEEMEQEIIKEVREAGYIIEDKGPLITIWGKPNNEVKVFLVKW